jgi:hypothetical protein
LQIRAAIDIPGAAMTNRLAEAATQPATQALCRAFREAGKPLYLVGGAVRDRLRGLAGKDLDYATAATPPQIKDILRRAGFPVIPIGEAFGTIATLIQMDMSAPGAAKARPGRSPRSAPPRATARVAGIPRSRSALRSSWTSGGATSPSMQWRLTTRGG